MTPARRQEIEEELRLEGGGGVTQELLKANDELEKLNQHLLGCIEVWKVCEKNWNRDKAELLAQLETQKTLEAVLAHDRAEFLQKIEKLTNENHTLKRMR